MMVSLHEIIFSWSTETSRISQRCERPIDRTSFDEELGKIGELYNQYKDEYDEFMAYPPIIREKMYSPDAEN